MSETGSLVAIADTVRHNGHALRPLDGWASTPGVLKEIVDPPEPLNASRILEPVRDLLPGRRHLLLAALAGLTIIGLTAAWYFTPVADVVNKERVQHVMSSVNGTAWAPFLVVALFLAGGAVAFPVTVLIAATAATFGPWLGFVYSVLGVLASAVAMYVLGAILGPGIIQSLVGEKWKKIRNGIANRGVLAIAAVRLVPLAPFTIVNIAAGACAIGVIDYVAGTLIGMLPGMMVISLLGDQLTAIIRNFSPGNAALLVLFALCWFGLAWLAQFLVARFHLHQRNGEQA
jgi:uncharacterized membrane protein YdjX (TVP38/TMEM64 family)